MSRFSPTASELAPQASRLRGAIDSLVQSALVELFSAYQVAVAPLPRLSQHRVPALPEVSAAVSFTLRGRFGPPGRLTLSLPSTLLDVMVKGGGSALKNDWTRELANQLIGRIKNRLLQFSAVIVVGSSSSLDSKALQSHLSQVSSARVYVGRTRHGEILVTLEGMPDESQLSYVGPVDVVSEGTTILF